jgi:hypothetical protein
MDRERANANKQRMWHIRRYIFSWDRGSNPTEIPLSSMSSTRKSPLSPTMMADTNELNDNTEFNKSAGYREPTDDRESTQPREHADPRGSTQPRAHTDPRKPTKPRQLNAVNDPNDPNDPYKPSDSSKNLKSSCVYALSDRNVWKAKSRLLALLRNSV